MVPDIVHKFQIRGLKLLSGNQKWDGRNDMIKT
jgi:hypothetical protein